MFLPIESVLFSLALEADVMILLKLVAFLVSATLCIAGTPRVIGKARPCEVNRSPRSYKCIGRNLAANSRCKLRLKPVLSQYRVASHRFETPYFNASYIDRNLIISGLDRCFVSEFFYNINSDSGVLGVDCPELTFMSDRTLLQHRPLEEDTIYNYSYNGTYPRIRLTMTLCNVDVLDICKEFTLASVDGMPNFNISPKDIKTRNFLSQDLSMLNIFERETFFYRANLLIRNFINSRLCNFGCE